MNQLIFYEKVLKSKHGVYFDDTKFNMRDIKQYFALNNLNKECAVIGSSVTDMINGSLSDTDMDNGSLSDKELNNFSNLEDHCSSILNLSIPQSVYEEYFALSYMLLQNPNPPKKIIINIDPTSFSKFNYFWDYFEDEYYSMYNMIFLDKQNEDSFFTIANKLKRYLETILSLEYFLISIKETFLSVNLSPEEPEYFNRNTGSLGKHVTYSNGSGVNEQKYRQEDAFNVKEDLQIINNIYFQENAYLELEKLILYLKKHFDVMVLMTPRHENNFSKEFPMTLKALEFIEKKNIFISK